MLQNAADGIIASIWQKSDRTANPVALYIVTLLGGVTLGPVQGSVVGMLDWRWYVNLVQDAVGSWELTIFQGVLR